MSNQTKGVIAGGRSTITSRTYLFRPPGGCDQVQACGVCHTDLHYREGAINDEFPFLLGHEAAGTVESVGDGVTNVAPGDFVIIAWRAPCGNCRSCLRGRPWYCFESLNADQQMTLADGSPLSPALGIGAFTELTLVHSGQAVKIDPAASAAAAGLIGCGVMAGLGAAVNTGGVTRGTRLRFWMRRVGTRPSRDPLAGAHTYRVDIDDRKLDGQRLRRDSYCNSTQTDAVERSESKPVKRAKWPRGRGIPQPTRQASSPDLAGRWCLSAYQPGHQDRATNARGFGRAARSSRPGTATAFRQGLP